MRFKTDEELYKTIGQNIKALRQKAKITQVQLANATQFSASYLSKIEALNCNKSISLAALNQIANALDVEITEFFKETNIK